MGREEKPKLGWKAKRERRKRFLLWQLYFYTWQGWKQTDHVAARKYLGDQIFFFFRRRRSFMRPFDAVGLVLWSHEFSYELLLFYFILFFSLVSKKIRMIIIFIFLFDSIRFIKNQINIFLFDLI
jgi:hypothetical protein